MQSFFASVVVAPMFALAASACATVSEAEFRSVVQQVRTTKGDAPSNCTEIGSFQANGGIMGFGHAKDILRYKVGKAGGNLVALDVASTGPYGNAAILSGTGYKCPQARKKGSPKPPS